MPHVIVKLASGRSDEDKTRLANRIALAVMNSLGIAESTISVAIEDVDPQDWTASVYDPEIAGRAETLYRKPGYARF